MRRANAEYVPLLPFQRWLEERIAEMPYDRFLDGIDGRHSRLAKACGVDGSQLTRWRNGTGDSKGHPGMIDLLRVDEVLTEHGGHQLWEVYQQDVEEMREEFCPTCSDETTVGDDGLCPWCETPVGKLRVVLPPRVGKPRLRVVRTGKKLNRYLVAPRPGSKDFVPIERPTFGDYELREAKLARGAGRYAGLTDGTLREVAEIYVDGGTLKAAVGLVWRGDDEHGRAARSAYADEYALYQACQRYLKQRHGSREAIAAALVGGNLRVDSGPKPKPPTAFARAGCDLATLHEAAWLYYYEEIGFVKIGARLLHRTSYTTPHACGNAMCRMFKRMGWPARDRIEATRAASYKHGLKPRKGTNTGKYNAWRKAKKGERQRCTATSRKTDARCTRFAPTGKKVCYAHDPDFEARRVAGGAARAAAVNADLVPVGPFQAWLRARVKEASSALALAGRWPDVKVSTLYRVLNGAPGKTPGMMRKRTIERVLEASNTGTRFEDLYTVVHALPDGPKRSDDARVAA